MEKEVKQTENKNPEKRSVVLMVFLSIITLNIYYYAWLIKRSKELNTLNTLSKIDKKYSIGLLILSIFIYIVWIICPFIIKCTGFSIPIIIILIISIITCILILVDYFFIIFRMRKMLNEAWQNKKVIRKVSGFFTFIFGAFYLQYELNRTIDDTENEKRVGPWVCLSIMILFPIILSIIAILSTRAI